MLRMNRRLRIAFAASWLAASALCVGAIGCITPPAREEVLRAEQDVSSEPREDPATAKKDAADVAALRQLATDAGAR